MGILDDLPTEAAPLARVRTRALEDLGQGPPTLRRCAARAVARVHAHRRLELVAHLVWRELRLRYHGSVLGASWVVLQPLAQLVTLVFLFSRVVPLGIEAYPAFVFSGLLPWAWFSASLAAAGGAFVGNRDLPRAARLAGLARRIQVSSGTGLAGVVETAFEASTRPNVARLMEPAELARYEAEGAAMSLADGVRYALGETEYA
jgi:hypothetical protein